MSASSREVLAAGLLRSAVDDTLRVTRLEDLPVVERLVADVLKTASFLAPELSLEEALNVEMDAAKDEFLSRTIRGAA